MATKVVNPGEKILVTGVNGFIAQHVANEALQKGILVRGTVRSAEKAVPLHEVFDEKYGKGKFESIVVSDMAKEGSFDQAIKGVSGVVHVASDMSMSSDFYSITKTVVDGINLLLAAAAKEPSVKRFVLTSSSVAGADLKKRSDKIIDDTDWNQESVRLAKPESEGGVKDDDPKKGNEVYAASKVLSEKAAWKFMEENKPKFVLNTVLPNMNLGPKLHPSLNGSSSILVHFVFNGQVDYIKTMNPEHFVHVADDGLLHVLLLTSSSPPYSTTGARVWAVVKSFNFHDVLVELRSTYPDRKFVMDEELPDNGQDLGRIDNSAAVKLLKEEGGRPDGFRSFRETIQDNTTDLV